MLELIDERVVARFWKHTPILPPSECWEWIGSRKDTGYGQLNINQMPKRAHRVSFAIHNGFLPSVVRHTCDNPPCVNPNHLVAGSQRDNMYDAISRGRMQTPPPPPQGEANWASKLTIDLVKEIRERHAAGGTYRGLAREYGVDRTTIKRAVNGTCWNHID